MAGPVNYAQIPYYPIFMLACISLKPTCSCHVSVAINELDVSSLVMSIGSCELLLSREGGGSSTVARSHEHLSRSSVSVTWKLCACLANVVLNDYRGSFGELGSKDNYYHVEPLDRNNLAVGSDCKVCSGW